MALTVGVKTVLPVGSREAVVVATCQGKALAKSMGWIIICGHCQHLQMHHLALIVVDEDVTAGTWTTPVHNLRCVDGPRSRVVFESSRERSRLAVHGEKKGGEDQVGSTYLSTQHQQYCFPLASG
jgi:hypothetical protein